MERQKRMSCSVVIEPPSSSYTSSSSSAPEHTHTLPCPLELQLEASLEKRENELALKSQECDEWKQTSEENRVRRLECEKENENLRNEVMQLRLDQAKMMAVCVRYSYVDDIDVKQARKWLKTYVPRVEFPGGRREREAMEEWQNRAIFQSVRMKCLNALKYLLCVEKLDGSIVDEYKRTCAHVAAEQGDLETLKFLAAVGVASATKVDAYGNPWSHYAAKSGHVDTLQWLLQTTSKETLLNARNGRGGTLSHSAVSGGSRASLRFLHSVHCLQPHVRDSHGQHLAHIAATKGHLSVLEWLHSHQLLITGSTIVDSHSRTIAHIAAKKQRLDILQYLHKIGALDPKATDKDHLTVFDLTKKKGTCSHWLRKNGLAYASKSSK